MDGGECLPEEERDEPDADDGADEAEEDAGVVGRRRAQPVLARGRLGSNSIDFLGTSPNLSLIIFGMLRYV